MRTTGKKVKGILDTSLSDTELNPFIKSANILVSEEVDNGNVPEQILTEVEKWLAAHFASQRDQRVSKESQGGSEFSYQGSTGMGLDSSDYGQQAQLLDPTGNLENLDSGKEPFKFDNLMD